MSSHFGIIGYPLAHSFSAAYFKKKFASLGIDAVYETFPLTNINDFPALLSDHPGLKGLSVTIPYKETVMPYLDDMDSVAAEVGAVNSIAINNSIKKGFNTDLTGFTQSLNPLLTAHHKNALVLGTGGASKAVAYVLKQLGIPFQKVSRTPKEGCLTYDDLMPQTIAEHKLIINTTPAGMYPNVHDAPHLPYDSLTPHHLLYDLIYNPEETLFLKHGKEKGATVKNGFEMLHIQAEASWEIWNRTAPDK